MKNLSIILLGLIVIASGCQDDPVNEISCADGIQNGDETGIDCGGSCTDTCFTCDEYEIKYADQGEYGNNLLRSGLDTMLTNPIEVFSMEATKVAACTEFRIEMSKIDGQCEGCWFYNPGTDLNWSISNYDMANNSQVFTSTGDQMDLRIFGFADGLYEMKYFINDSLIQTNHLKSEAKRGEVFLTNEPINFMTKGENYLFVNSQEGDYFGTLDLTQANPVVENKFTGSSQAMAIKEGVLYYFSFTNKAIEKIDLTGGATQPVTVIENLEGIFELAFYGDILLFNQFGDNSSHIAQVDLSQEEPTVTELVGRLGFIAGLQVVNDHLYFINDSFSVERVDLTHSTPSREMVISFANDPSPLQLLNIDVTADHIYYASGGQVGRIDRNTLEIETLIATSFWDIYLDVHAEDDYVLYTNPYAQKLEVLYLD